MPVTNEHKKVILEGIRALAAGNWALDPEDLTLSVDYDTILAGHTLSLLLRKTGLPEYPMECKQGTPFPRTVFRYSFSDRRVNGAMNDKERLFENIYRWIKDGDIEESAVRPLFTKIAGAFITHTLLVNGTLSTEHQIRGDSWSPAQESGHPPCYIEFGDAYEANIVAKALQYLLENKSLAEKICNDFPSLDRRKIRGGRPLFHVESGPDSNVVELRDLCKDTHRAREYLPIVLRLFTESRNQSISLC
ncbi:MAG: hypothetical protein IT567_07315 [Alphaproteobacteria bacterium]|nr:hypothetical protein [Alphaproteobacteria bacterium]